MGVVCCLPRGVTACTSFASVSLGSRSSAFFSVFIRPFVASPLALPFSLRRLPFPLSAVISPRVARTRAPPVRSHAPNIALIFHAIPIACATEVGRSHTCQDEVVASLDMYGHADGVKRSGA